jgi:hypothetical protein
MGEPVLSHLANQAPHIDTGLAADEGMTCETAHSDGQHGLYMFQQAHLLQLVWDSKPLGLPGQGVWPIPWV